MEEREFVVCAQGLLFAGRQILLRTNAPKIAGYVSDFFPAYDMATDHSAGPAAEITLMITEGESTAGDGFPWFRGRGEFAVAQFTPDDTLWFNLRARRVFGSFSAAVANDRERWRRHIFPTLFGILAAAVDVAPVHAACLARDTGGLLLAAPSGTGKSTLAVALGRRGYTFLSDDWTCLALEEGVIRASGFPMPVKLLPDADRFFPELRSYRTGISLNGELAFEVSPVDCFGLQRVRSCAVTCIILLERTGRTGCDISEIDFDEAAQHLIAEIEPLEGSLAACYERQIDLIHHLKGAACFRLHFDENPDVVAEELDAVCGPWIRHEHRS
ncbi:hypothetical protein [Paracidobacterium acidisoli]|uniref:Serine kinase n=1 Tax=Paracidobacterium acidisoli TaxID=2303751 RepID=A0A372ILK6_9BACT|nr:hypothetical protein [Paracidobacterium acidisoli]MBT9332356.1 hypothetical protein [Paracidobacterium acidisoli]